MRLPSFSSRSGRSRLLVTVGVAGTALAAACGIGIRRDFSTIPPGQVGFDDMCGLQDYFDTIEAKLAAPPSLVSAVDMESQSNARVQGGKNRFSFESEFQLKQLRRILEENWKSLPEPLANADRIDIEVHWSEKAGVQRVVTDSDAELIVGHESFALPYQVCLSELLFGAPLYRQRRIMAGRMLPYKPLFGDGGIKLDNPDAGAAASAAMPVPASAASVSAPPAAPPPAAPVRAASPTPDAAPPRPIFKQAPPAQ